MPVNPDLLEILVCPVCVTERVTPIEGETKLLCKKCGRAYPVKDDIPVMLIDEATIAGAGQPS